MPPEPVGGAGCLGVIGDDSRGMRRTGPLQVTPWWMGRAGGRDGDGATRGRCAGCRGRFAQSTSASASAPRRARRGAPAAAGAGRWMRSSRAPGPARSGCGTSRAASGSYAAPTPPSVGGAAGSDRGGPLRTQPAATLAGLDTARNLAARQARRGGRDLGAARPSRCDGPVLQRSGRRAATAQQVTWSMAMTAPSAWFQTGITSGVGSSSTWQRWRSK
jgi:hypothetical protein